MHEFLVTQVETCRRRAGAHQTRFLRRNPVGDVNLPGTDGRELCRILRRTGIRTPILMMTATATDADTITCRLWRQRLHRKAFPFQPAASAFAGSVATGGAARNRLAPNPPIRLPTERANPRRSERSKQSSGTDGEGDRASEVPLPAARSERWTRLASPRRMALQLSGGNPYRRANSLSIAQKAGNRSRLP
jgi:CheY-like chemotaxis protein